MTRRTGQFEDLDAAEDISPQDYSGESPHLLELFVGHKLLAEDGIGDDNRTVRDVENGDAVVQEKCVPDNSQGNADAF